MELVLKIENETSLPDGGPISIAIQGTRGIDIGRDQYLDWTLPDPSRFISGKHCEVRWHDGAYWLHDVSTNGTFLDGADGRLKAPHKLRNGDRFSIGHYIILATVSGEASRSTPDASSPNVPPGYDSLWDPVEQAAPPIDPKQLKAPRDLQPVKPDFLDWAIDVPTAHPSASSDAQSQRQRSAASPAADDDMWAQGPPKRVPPEPQAEVAPIPSPRRPTWLTGEPSGPWADASPPAESRPPSSPAGAGAALTSASQSPVHQQARETVPGAADSRAADDLLRLIARGAGLPEDAFAARNPAELAGELGQFVRLVAESLKQLLDARQQAKRLTRSSNQTTIQALDNNPLKFAPTAEDALRIMFGPQTKGYLNARDATSQGFGDLKTHQVKTFSAMQLALKRLLDELDPEAIEKASASRRGLADVVGSRKARLWDAYLACWAKHTQGHQDGMLDAFMSYFAEYYDRDGNRV